MIESIVLICSQLDCQWIDVTDVFAGKYVMRINVNPQRQVAESDFTNNIVICEVTYYGSFAHSSRCSYSKWPSTYMSLLLQ